MGKRSRMKRERTRPPEGAATQPVDGRGKKFAVVTTTLLVIAIVALGTALRMRGIDTVTSRSPDEMVYTGQAATMADKGLDGVRTMIREYNEKKELWIFPLPHRIGYLGPVALAMKVAGARDVKVGSYVSCLFSVIALLLTALFGFRFFGKNAALTALLFMSVSPAELALARRTWQDAMVGCVGLALIYITCEIVRSPLKSARYIFFAVVGGYGALVKESGVMLFGVCAFFIVWELLIRQKAAVKTAVFILWCFLGVAVSGAIAANAAGGLSNIIEALRHYREVMGTAAYGAKYCSGPWYQIVKGAWILSPIVTVACIITAVEGLMPVGRVEPGEGRERNILKTLILIVVAFTVITTILPNLKNLRYTSPIDGPVCLLAAFGIWKAAAYVGRSAQRPVAGILTAAIVISVAAVSFFDYQRFVTMIEKTGVKDLAIVSLDNIRKNIHDY